MKSLPLMGDVKHCAISKIQRQVKQNSNFSGNTGSRKNIFLQESRHTFIAGSHWLNKIKITLKNNAGRCNVLIKPLVPRQFVNEYNLYFTNE